VDVPNAATLPQVFKNAGYTTLSNGKIFHHTDDAESQSWSQPAWRPEISHSKSYDPETTHLLSNAQRGRIYESPDVADDSYHDGKVALKTINDLQGLKQAGKPFFLACGFIRPHMPFYAPKKYWDLYDRAKIQIAENRYRPKNAPAELKGSGEYKSYHPGDLKDGTEEWHRMMRHGYMACASYSDKLTGDVLAELDRLGLADNTIVVIWGDHGWHLGEHDFWGKHNTMHIATRAPLIIKAPGKKGGCTKSLVDMIDIFPTICSLAGIAIPDTVQGKSLVGLWDHPEQPHRQVAYSRFLAADTVITPRFNYTSYSDGKSEMLYDLEKDPNENENVAGEPEYLETLTQMKALLKQQKDEAAKAKDAVTLTDKMESKPKTTTPKKASLPETEDNEYSADVPTPTHAGVSYGSHERNILDFWQAKSDQPTPLVLVIHGGGWMGGSKERLSRFVDPNALLKAGISVAAINYRLMKHAERVVPPVKAPLHDAARALQFLRSKAGEWNIDKSRIGAAGGSAGACSSLWLAYHDDLSDPKSQDPVARESTRLQCAGVMGPQTSLDPQQMKEWTPNCTYGGHAFGKKDFAEFLADREKILPWIAEYSPYALATKDDPPVALFYNSAPALGKDQKDPTHSANFGIGLQQHCQVVGIDCDLVYPGAPDVKHQTPTDYLIAKLGGKQHDAD